MKYALVFLVYVFTFSLNAQNKPVYPEPKEGFKRVDLILPKVDHQENLNVEVKFAIEIELENCESGTFSLYPNLPKEFFGIGNNRFPYYIIEGNNVEYSVGRNNNCNGLKMKKMIYSSQEISMSYQSSYAIPFYIPKNWNLVYRVWSTTDSYIMVK